MPDAYNPWGAPVFPTAADNAMQPETFVPQGVQDWTRQAAPKDYNILSQIAGSLGKALMYPGQVAQSQTPISTEDMVGPAFNLAGMLTLGAGAAPQEANALNMGIKAYHGSPHDFDRFDLSKIGTGEGAQAYGHGLYFADSEGVAKSYRDALAPKWDSYVDGQKAKHLGQPHWEVADRMASLGMSPEQFLQHRIDQISKAEAAGNPMRADISRDILNEERPIIESMLGKKVDKGPGGHMYEVNINADPSHFLDWDKPLSQQSPQVQAAFAHEAPTETGSEAFHKLQNALIENKIMPNAASDVPLQHLQAQHLREAGIPGIKYLDQGSRTAGEGSSNYVVFNHDLIDIMRKYAVPGMLGAPILANALSEQKT